MNLSRETLLTQTFVELADTLVSDFDVVDFLHILVTRSVELLDVAESGLMLADAEGTLHVMTSSSERTNLLELFEIQNEEGPCLDCYASGEAVACEDMTLEGTRWPVFAPECQEAGFGSVYALPLRLRADVIGALNLFRESTGRLTQADLDLGRALADVATIGILQQRAVHLGQTAVDQLQTALNSRIVIEQAKGMLAERAEIDMTDAFNRLRQHARSNHLRLSQVAEDLVLGKLDSALISKVGY
ncbi:GAF and ANTAR domain-containing protein [soil metagenome]